MDSDDQVEPRAFNPDGAVFVSYRQSDGSVLAEEVSWALRGCGLPVWRDKQDLLPGDFNERIRQAFDEGISAAVVVITPDIAHSQVVKTVEVPQLLALHQLEPRFSLAILNAVATDGGRLDYAAPDSLLDIEGAYLKDTKQYAHAGAGIKELSVEMARRRMIELSRTNDSVLPIDIQTRTWPQASDARRGLVVRLRPSADAARVPPMDAYRNFQTFLSACPQLLSASGADRVEVSGGAHLSMAFGIGVSLPRVRHIPLTVVDSAGSWDSTSNRASATTTLQVEASDVSAGNGRLAVYVDVAEYSGDPLAFERWLERNRSLVNRRVVVRALGGRIDSPSGQRLAEQIEGVIRENALPLQHGHVDLFLRASFPVAVLLGRLLNTLTVTVYEWDNSSPPATYVEVATYEYGTNPLAGIASQL